MFEVVQHTIVLLKCLAESKAGVDDDIGYAESFEGGKCAREFSYDVGGDAGIVGVLLHVGGSAAHVHEYVWHM